MSESSEKNDYIFAVLELDLEAQGRVLLQGDKDFLILGKLNSRLEFTHDQSLAFTLSGYQGVVEMNNKMGNIPKRVIKENNNVQDTIEEVPGIRSLILTNIMTAHMPYKYFCVIQVGIQTRCLIYFYFEKIKDKKLNDRKNEIIKQLIRNNKNTYLKDNFLRIVGDKEIKIAELKREISELQRKIRLISDFYPDITGSSSGGSKKSKKNTRRKRKAKKTRKAKRTNKK